jgi:hypothetical protein
VSAPAKPASGTLIAPAVITVTNSFLSVFFAFRFFPRCAVDVFDESTIGRRDAQTIGQNAYICALGVVDTRAAGGNLRVYADVLRYALGAGWLA